MKNIGVISYNIHCNFTNYGSALQSWAMKEAINSIDGFNAKLIDYCPEILKDKDPLNPMKNMWDSNEELKRQCELSLPAIKKNYYKFDDFYTNRFDRTKKMYDCNNFNDVVLDEKIDAFLCGSDTIFCVDEFGLDDGYYANYDCMKNGYTVSYAASFGDSHFTEDTYKQLDERLKNFKAIGIRENGMVSYIKDKVNVPVKKVIDPTLLLTVDKYNSIVSRPLCEKKYVLLYSRRHNEKMDNFAEELAKKNSWQIIEISIYAEHEKKHKMAYDAGVEEFLSLVKNAEYVVTNSYHGMIFAVQFHKQFVVFSREQCDTKISELLDSFKLSDRLLINGDENYKKTINYEAVDKRIKKMRDDSFEFLKFELNNINPYLDSNNKQNCCGCESCKNVCPKSAIDMVTDENGFRYPMIDKKKCINCGLCRKVCPYINFPKEKFETPIAFGGFIKDKVIRDKSTSGGAFSAIVNAFSNKEKKYVIFGAKSKGFSVFHDYVFSVDDIDCFRKSKYSQSVIGSSYKDVKVFLNNGYKVLFSGTPCQISGLYNYLGNIDKSNLLTVEVVCEGVPSPLYIKRYNEYILKKYGGNIIDIDYRYTSSNKKLSSGKWDFQVMKLVLDNGKTVKIDRWINPFWKLWLNHLMSRPSCYKCPFAKKERYADITLGDLWGVHIYCPDLYGKNMGSSLIIANTVVGKNVLKETIPLMYGRYLNFDDALKYQSPLRNHIVDNVKREEFMEDLRKLSYEDLIKKWYEKPSGKLLFNKYVWGNRQKVFCWNLKRRLKNERND